MRDTPLTSDERARLPEFITHWARIGLSAQPIEHSAAERAIAALYAWAGLPKPRIVWAPCPMTALLSLILYSRLRHRGRAEGSRQAKYEACARGVRADYDDNPEQAYGWIRTLCR